MLPCLTLRFSNSVFEDRFYDHIPTDLCYMASRNYDSQLDNSNGHDNGYNNSNDYDDRSSGVAASANSYREPHVFLDLRNYYSSSRQDTIAQPAVNRYRHESQSYSRSSDHISPTSASNSSRTQSEYKSRAPNGERLDTSYFETDRKSAGTTEARSYPRNQDYICPPSESRSSRSRSDYISPSSKAERYQTSHSTQAYSTYGGTRSHQTEYVSPWDKSDYQMIKEGGWSDKKHFMESYGISFYEHGAFDEARDILDGFRRIDAQAAADYTSEPERGSDCIRGHGRHRDSDAAFDDEDRIGVISDYGKNEHVDDQKDCSRGYRGVGRANVSYHDSPGVTYQDDLHYSKRSDDYRNASYHKTSITGYCGAQEYPQRMEDDRNSSYYEGSKTGYGDERGDSQGVEGDSNSSDCDSTDAIDYDSDSGTDNGEMGGDDFADDQSTEEYDDDDYQ